MKKRILLTIFAFVACLSKAQISEIIEYYPAPGQFINTGYSWPESVEKIKGPAEKAGLITLGFWGGYIIVGFDQPIENDPNNPYGVDFTIFGNPFKGSSEPGIVQVMKDENGNGKPDDTWYELMGSDHHLSSTKYNYAITYTNPHGKYEVPWTDNEGEHGVVNWKSVSGFHPQEFYPSPDSFPNVDPDSCTFHGTLLKNRTRVSGGYWANWRFDYGYVDNNWMNDVSLNTPDNPYTLTEREGSGGDAFDIHWAIDKNGKHVDLDKIHWVKIYNGISQNAGWLGEISTEVKGITDVDPDPSVQGETRCIVSNHPPHVGSYPAPDHLTWQPGKDFQFESYIVDMGRKMYPNEAANYKILWESNDHAVATITNTGLFSPVSEGTVIITATYEDDPSISRQFEIKIAADKPPVVSNPIPDVSVKNNSSQYVVALRDVFDDPDDKNAEISKVVKSNSNPSLISTKIESRGLILTIPENKTGKAKITVEAISNGQTATDEFTINIIEDIAPTVTQAIADTTIPEDANLPIIDLAHVFDDADNANFWITKKIQSNSNESLLTATITGNDLQINLKPDQNGKAEIIVQATSGGKSVADTFSITVTPVDDAPILANPIADTFLQPNAPNSTISLSDIFADVDNEDADITKIVKENTNPGLVSASISGDHLILSFTPNTQGTAKIVIEAFSNGKAITAEFMVVITEDFPPTVAQAIADITVSEDESVPSIDLSHVFDDADNDNSLITKEIHENNNTQLLTANISGNELQIELNPNQNGQAQIIVQANSNGKTVADTFSVIVNPIDDVPTLANPIADITIAEDESVPSIDLSHIFDDIDNDNSLITKEIHKNNNKQLLTATISGNDLQIKLNPNQNGQAQIIVQGTSGGKTLTDTFSVTVNPVDDAPTLANPIADITVSENASIPAIDLSHVFNDIDNVDSLITKEIQSNSNEELLSATITGDALQIELKPDQNGQAQIIVQANSNGQTVTDTFQVIVSPASDIQTLSAKDLKIYPNPSNGVFKIQSEQPSDFTVRIFDQQGKLIYSQIHGKGEIDLSNRPAGTYVVQIIQDKSLIIKKINIF